MNIYSVSFKLLLFTVAVIVLSIISMGYLIDTSLLEYHRETANKEISNGFGSLQKNILKVEQELSFQAKITKSKRFI